MAPTSKTCTRPGCGKKLNDSNTKGMCSSGCLSPEAPVSLRAAGAGGVAEVDVLRRFRRVAKALGKDPEAILDEAMRKVAAQWLETVEEAVR